MFLRAISQQLRPLSLRQAIIHRSIVQENFLRPFPTVVTFRGIKTNSFNDAKQSFADATKNRRRVKQMTVDKEKLANGKEMLMRQHDPDVFGTFSETKPFNESASEEPEDEGDVAEDEYISNKPFRLDQLSTKQYAEMIKRHLKFKRVKEAIDVLEVRMIKEDRVKPENYIYNLLISECGRLGYTQKAFQLYNRMKQRRLKVTGATYTALFNACSRSPYPTAALEQAHHLRKTMLQSGYIPNETNYNVMIKAFGRCNDIDTAFELVDEMKDKKMLIKVDTFNFLLQACISDKEHGFRHALLVWHKIYRKRLSPDLYSFNLLLRCAHECGIGDLPTLRNLIAQILSENNVASGKKLKVLGGEQKMLKITPKTATKHNESESQEDDDTDDEQTTLTVSAETGANQIEPKVAATAIDRVGIPPNLISRTPHLGSLVALKAVEKPEDRLLLLGGMNGFFEEMKTAGVVPDIKTFTKMLDVIPATLDAEHKLIALIRAMNMPVDVDFFNILMKRRSMRCDYEGAKDVLVLIEIAQLKPDIVTFGLLALGCKTVEDTKNFMQRLEGEGVRINVEIAGALLKNACYVRDYDYVLEVLNLCKVHGVKLSPQFVDCVYKFDGQSYSRSHHQNPTEHDRKEFYRFSRKFKQWLKDMNLKGLDQEAAIKQVKEHPWKQFKEAQLDGEEPLKNTRKQKWEKKKHFIHKLTITRLENRGQPTQPQAKEKKLKSADETKALAEKCDDEVKE